VTAIVGRVDGYRRGIYVCVQQALMYTIRNERRPTFRACEHEGDRDLLL